MPSAGRKVVQEGKNNQFFMSLDQIAAIEGISRQRAQQLLQQAMRHFKAELERRVGQAGVELWCGSMMMRD